MQGGDEGTKASAGGKEGGGTEGGTEAGGSVSPATSAMVKLTLNKLDIPPFGSKDASLARSDSRQEIV